MKKIRRAAVLIALACGAPRSYGQDISVALSQQRDKAYEVEGRFVVEASTAVVWEVLTDYDRIDRFVPSMKRSKVAGATEDGGLVVEQEAVGGAFVFTKRVRVRLEVRRDAGRLDFKDVGREHFWDYSGSWSTAAAPGGTEVVYKLTMIPDFLIPSFMLRSGMRKGARELLTQVRAEMLRRQAAR